MELMIKNKKNYTIFDILQQNLVILISATVRYINFYLIGYTLTELSNMTI